MFAFIEERISVTNFISGLFLFATQTHAAVGPLIEGHYIEDYPMVSALHTSVTGQLTAYVFVAGVRLHKHN